MNIQEQLRDYITSQFLFEQNQKTLGFDDDLLNQGIVDSMGILQVVNYMEEKFGIHVNDEEIIPENFRSLRTLTDFVMQKSGTQSMA